MLTPIGTSGRWWARRSASAPAPLLLNPIRFSRARSAGSRNRRGSGLPGWGPAVTVPTSAYPKPSAPQTSSPTPSLSKPAANPSGPGKRTPNTVLANRGSAGPSSRRSNRRTTAAAVTPRSTAEDRPSQFGLVGPSVTHPRLLAPQQNSPAAVGIEAHPRQLPAAILGLDGQPGGRAEPRHFRWQPQRDPLVFVGHVGVPARRQPIGARRGHRAPPACSITCTPAPDPDTTYKVSDASSKASELGCCTVG